MYVFFRGKVDARKNNKMKKLTIVQIYDFPETIYGRHWEHRAHNILIITVTPYNINKIVLCRLSLVLDGHTVLYLYHGLQDVQV